MPYTVTLTQPGAEPIPREFWREVPCGHPQDPVAAYSPDGSAACHCGALLFFQDALPCSPTEAPGPIVLCSKCACHVAIPEVPTVVVSRRAVATLEEARHEAELALINWQRETGQKPDPRVHVYAARTLPESGGTITLPDGMTVTTVTVEFISWRDLGNHWPLGRNEEQALIVAFNAKFAAGSPSTHQGA